MGLSELKTELQNMGFKEEDAEALASLAESSPTHLIRSKVIRDETIRILYHKYHVIQGMTQEQAEQRIADEKFWAVSTIHGVLFDKRRSK